MYYGVPQQSPCNIEPSMGIYLSNADQSRMFALSTNDTGARAPALSLSLAVLPKRTEHPQDSNPTISRMALATNSGFSGFSFVTSTSSCPTSSSSSSSSSSSESEP